ncbi:hypothetical protein GCM10009549_47240 [Streptomyces thermoalcalitolerans]|uniref:Uncharacterized protein n=1 Tax=Streptomyces thermoalcalitolerans TaxID=65605 RepID=A0ABN1PC54_9ACTN
MRPVAILMRSIAVTDAAPAFCERYGKAVVLVHGVAEEFRGIFRDPRRALP